MPLIIPVFIPHEGCPHACVFCNQHRISGRITRNPVSPGEVVEIISRWLARGSKRRTGPIQVAFYGGSFTGLPAERQKELLEAVAPFMDQGRVQAIRISTRPDYVDPVIIDRLRRSGVQIVELGVQSLDPVVLAASRRGHSADQALRAIALLREANLQVGVQLMVGLPGESLLSLRRTARQVASLRPDFVRIYPVLVLKGSGLAALHAQGRYRPLTLEQAVARTAWMYRIFAGCGIGVVRMGLQPGSELEDALLAGPYHPAFGELVLSRLMLRQTRRALRGVPAGDKVRLSIAARDRSIFQGMHSANINLLRRMGLRERFELVTDPGQPRATLRKIATTRKII
jgi:histone acetyltransferase (RNA polymerase elongator complex component)